jgi:hypothetical protein
LSPVSPTVDVMTTTFTPNALAWFEVFDIAAAERVCIPARCGRQPARRLHAAGVKLCA